MTKPACRKVIADLWPADPPDAELPGASNAGLVRDRYLKVPVKDKGRHPNSRKGLFRTMLNAQKEVHPIYKEAFTRYTSTLHGAKDARFKTKGRMILGLGNENVLETGITLQHIYGTPLIPGTALKGLASHYCDQIWGISLPEFKRGGEYHTAIFGTSDDSGHIIFHDAWITPESLGGRYGLLPDVMTPHHGDYYSGDGPPTDFDDPNPVTFLSVAGTFHVAVSCDVPGEDGDKWADLALRLLTDALREWGIGGKTSSGYGRLIQVGNDVSSDPVAGPPGEPWYRDLRGTTIMVTRAQDPNPKKNRPYFVAADGFGGFIEIGDRNTITTEIGETCELIVYSFQHGDNRYSFAIPGAWDPE